jgi:hypothetical protein
MTRYLRFDMASARKSKNINKSFTVQKKAIRVIKNSNYDSHINQLQILPFPGILKFRKLQLMHSVYNNYRKRPYFRHRL